MSTLLEVKDLHVAFQTQKQKVHAVRGVSFYIKQGERLGIVGESGSGKSATAKALVKLLPSHTSSISGEVRFNDSNLVNFSEKEMQRVRGKEIGMIFQDPMTSLNPTIKIGKQIIEGFRRHQPKISIDAAYAYAIQMLELVGIPEAASRIEEYPHTLSGGMRQRVMIALALASKPKLLLADEPTTSLDVTIQAQILDLMKQLQKKTDTSILLITHDLSVVANFCDRVLVMYAGKIVESATVEELFSNPKHPYTERLLQSIPRLNMSADLPLIPIEGSPPDLFDPPAGCGFCPRCPYAMRICQEQTPPAFQVGDDHKSACFKHYPRGDRK
jgi:oligopeptide transport system ATP-binding protein